MQSEAHWSRRICLLSRKSKLHQTSKNLGGNDLENSTADTNTARKPTIVHNTPPRSNAAILRFDSSRPSSHKPDAILHHFLELVEVNHAVAVLDTQRNGSAKAWSAAVAGSRPASSSSEQARRSARTSDERRKRSQRCGPKPKQDSEGSGSETAYRVHRLDHEVDRVAVDLLAQRAHDVLDFLLSKPQQHGVSSAVISVRQGLVAASHGDTQRT